ncbi:MAG: PAS domain S-box protein, partial [Smithellaceae bacterium]
LWLIFVLQFTGYTGWITPGRQAALFMIPIITQVMIWTNSLHGLWVKQPVAFFQAGSFFIARIDPRIPGPWMWVHFAYSYLLVTIGLTLLIVMSFRVDPRDRRQVLTVGLGTLVMTVVSALPMLGLLRGISFNPLIPGMAVGMLIIFRGVYRHQFLRTPLVFRGEERAPAILVTLFILLIAGIIAAGYFSYRHYEKNYRTEFDHRLASVADLKAGELVQWRKERLADAYVLYGNENFIELVQKTIAGPDHTRAAKRLLIWMSQIQTAYQYKNVILLDASGGVRLSTFRPEHSVCEQIKEYILQIRQGDKPAFLDFHRETPGGAITLSVLVPLFEQTHLVGAVAFVIDPNHYLYPMLSRWPTPGESAETLLVRRDRDDVLFLNELKFQKGAALNLRFPLSRDDLPAARAARGEEGVMKGIDYRGVPVIAALRAIPDSPWFMVARMDKKEIYAPLRERLWLTLILVFVLIVGAVAVVMFLWQRQRNRFNTRQVEAAKALQLSEEKFRKAFMTSPDAVAITRSTDGLLVSVNKGFLDITGYTQEEIAGRTVTEIGIWETPQAAKELLETLRDKGVVRNFEARFHKKGGEIVLGMTSASIIELDGLPHILTITRDVTDRRRSEEMLRESEEKFRSVFEAANAGKSITRLAGEMQVNEAFCAMLGYSRDELMHRKWQALTHPDDVAQNQQMIDPLLRGETDTARFTKRYLHKNGSIVWADVSVKLMRDTRHQPLYFLTTVIDVTARKEAEAELFQLNEQLEIKVMERTAELTAKTDELERINKVFVDRELKMRELKERIKDLENRMA